MQSQEEREDGCWSSCKFSMEWGSQTGVLWGGFWAVDASLRCLQIGVFHIWLRICAPFESEGGPGWACIPFLQSPPVQRGLLHQPHSFMSVACPLLERELGGRPGWRSREVTHPLLMIQAALQLAGFELNLSS